MAFVRCVTVIMFGVLVMISAARADSLRADKSAPGDAPSINLDQSIPQAQSTGTDPSPSDADAAAADLEATRTAIDRRSAPTVTLSVSGWVGEQVMKTQSSH